MNKKRILLTALALILVCALSIMGTVAFLEAETNTVTNTFVAAGGPGPFVDGEGESRKFALKEYDVEASTTGKYVLKNVGEEGQVAYKEVESITYSNVMPGTKIPKNAFVKLSRSVYTDEDGKTYTPAPAYLFIEVIDGLPDDEYKWDVNAANWTQLMADENNALKGPKQGDVYLYTGPKADATTHAFTTISAYDAENYIGIIADNTINVENVELSADSVTLKFNAFLSQASVGDSDDPVEVFKACFLG